MKELVEYALEKLLEYAKYLEDNDQLTYDLLKKRVEKFKESVNGQVRITNNKRSKN